MTPTATDPAPPAAPAASPSRWGTALLIVVATGSTAALGALASTDAAAFYASLTQPPWAPPAAVFGPVWSVLFIAMAVAAVLAIRAPGAAARPLLLPLYLAQLALNALWSWVFFGWHQGALASVEVLVLLAAVVATALAFGRARPLAGALMLPYAVWVAFASVLTFTMWRLNPGAL